ncbi:AFG1/ZapE family ATPase, partial [Pseudomonas aeruginosa]|uniref:AFG1/ZapE family ATPase n=1 Tax=Pseudomonas aeruginosa TaxID=287 RepID=UPI003967FB7F
ALQFVQVLRLAHRATVVAAQQRFINLVDVLYDNDRRFFLSAEKALPDLVEGSDLPADMQRTASRLAQLRQLRC